jgi:hypothetical protein
LRLVLAHTSISIFTRVSFKSLPYNDLGGFWLGLLSTSSSFDSVWPIKALVRLSCCFASNVRAAAAVFSQPLEVVISHLFIFANYPANCAKSIILASFHYRTIRTRQPERARAAAIVSHSVLSARHYCRHRIFVLIVFVHIIKHNIYRRLAIISAAPPVSD